MSAITTLLIDWARRVPTLRNRTSRPVANGMRMRGRARPRRGPSAVGGPELARRDGPLAAGADERERRVEGEQTGSVSPAGEALAAFPPSVPRFWIWAAPIVAAASTSPGRCSRQSAERRISRVGGQRAEDDRLAVDRDPAQLVEPPQVDDACRRLAQLAGQGDHQVRAAGDRPRGVAGRRPGRHGPRPGRAGWRRRVDRHG